MGFTIETGISALTVFIQGLLSFFSPCVLPLVPLYLGYLAGGLNQGLKTEASPNNTAMGNAGKRIPDTSVFPGVLFYIGDQRSIFRPWAWSFSGGEIFQ